MIPIVGASRKEVKVTNEFDIQKWEKPTGDVVKDTLTVLAEGLTGIGASERKDLAFSVGHILQSLRKGQFLSRFAEEWKGYREKGKIKDDYHRTEQHQMCFQEFLDFLDHDLPDERRFDVLKRILLVAATEKISDRESLLPHEYVRLCRKMSAGEMVVLSTAYQIAQEDFGNSRGAPEWLKKVAERSGLHHPALVEVHEESLMKKYLLTGREYSDRSGVSIRPNFRLTTLAMDLCMYIAEYDQVEGPNHPVHQSG